MENKKMTKKDYFGVLLEMVSGNEELTNFIIHEIELLEKKSSKSGQTKTQKENETIKEKIVETLRELGRYATITDIQEANAELGAYSNQKISALLKQLVDTQVIEKMVDKKKAYFKA